jgi:hypothetical protein
MGHPLGVPTGASAATQLANLELYLIDRALRAGSTWAKLADTLGYPDGKTLKNHAKRLARDRERELRKGG